MATPPHWIVLARILRPQGRKGEVLAALLTDFPERFRDRPKVWIAPPGFHDPSLDGGSADGASPGRAAPEPAEVVSHWLPVGRNAGRVVLQFAGVGTIEAAERLAGREIVVPEGERLPLEAGAVYISDLVGSTVYDREVRVGIVEDVRFAASPDGTRRLEHAAPLLTVSTDEGGEVLIPFVKAYLVEADLAGKAIRMALPEGLTEINAPARRSGS